MECTILDKEQSSKIPLSYVNKYCTTEKMSTFLTFFPYVLILGPIILVVIERFFTRYVKMSNVISTEKKIISFCYFSKDYCGYNEIEGIL